MKGVELVKKRENPFDIFQILSYGSQIRQLEKEISDFMQYQMPDASSIRLHVKNLITELKSLGHLYRLRSIDES